MKRRHSIILSMCLGLTATSLSAADWLSLSGTEPAMIKVDGEKVANDKPRYWGFIQATYQKDYGDVLINPGGINQTPFSMLTPSVDSQSGFAVQRARLAVRGMLDKENTLNYFLMTEFGDNGITKPGGQRAGNYLTDASVTYRGVPYVNIRMGQFKYPGAEEGMRSVFASPYIEFTKMSDELLLERFIPNNAVMSTSAGVDFYQATPEVSVNAFRDRGVSLFHTTQTDAIRMTAAAMVGSGTGLSSENSSGKNNYYAYLAGEYLFGGGKAYDENSLKVFAWYHSGKRQLNNELFDRKRYGAGVMYNNQGLRLEAEYTKAEGMIYNGAKDANADPYDALWQFSFAADSENEASGYYLNAQYYVTQKLELIARYDYLDRLSNSAALEREFTTTTVGLSYHLQGPTRFDFNYAIRDAKAPGNATAQTVLDNIGNRVMARATYKF